MRNLFRKYRGLLFLWKMFVAALVLFAMLAATVEIHCGFIGNPSKQEWQIKYGSHGKWKDASTAEECRINTRRFAKSEFIRLVTDPVWAIQINSRLWLAHAFASLAFVIACRGVKNDSNVLLMLSLSAKFTQCSMWGFLS